MYSLLFIFLIAIASCTSEDDSPLVSPSSTPIVMTPKATEPFTPTATPSFTPPTKPPTHEPTPAAETAVPVNHEATPEKPIPIIVPEQPGLNQVTVSQIFIVQSPSLEWKLINHDSSLITLLSDIEANTLGEISGWQFQSIAPGQTVVIIEKVTAICETDPCPPGALIQLSVTIDITD